MHSDTDSMSVVKLSGQTQIRDIISVKRVLSIFKVFTTVFDPRQSSIPVIQRKIKMQF